MYVPHAQTTINLKGPFTRDGTAPAPLPVTAPTPVPWKWVALFPIKVFTRDGAVDGVPCPLGSVPIFSHSNNAVHGNGAVALSCKWTLRRYQSRTKVFFFQAIFLDLFLIFFVRAF